MNKNDIKTNLAILVCSAASLTLGTIIEHDYSQPYKAYNKKINEDDLIDIVVENKRGNKTYLINNNNKEYLREDLLPKSSELFQERNITYETIAQGNSCGWNYQVNCVIRDEQSLKTVWCVINSTMQTINPVPTIDFNKYCVIAVFQGKDYPKIITRVAEITEKENCIEVLLQHGETTKQMSMDIKPYHIVKIRKVQKKFIFK